MYLSKIKIIGFKSFANKTELKFNPGLSCIIGPNGSGKSNIVDAIRWVLGEQRTTVLRSDKMENVIFNGTRSRKPMGMAEVSMTIENTKDILKSEYRQVVITRRLYRSGESQYLINNVPVRLKDIIDIFMDTGLGSNSYSVIELKMVESILSENKTERRLLLEEAAGVVKYKIRRKSALRKLDATRTDLTRLNDIIGEVQKTVNSLSRQVGKARRYLNYSEELKKNDVNLSRYRYNRLLDEIRPLKLQLEEASKEKEESHHQITIDEALLEDYKRELIRREQELQELGRQIHEMDSKIAELNKEQAVDEIKKEEIGKNRKRYLADIADYKQKIDIFQQHLQQYLDELEDLNRQKEEVEHTYSAIEAERRQELEKLQAEKNEIDQLNQAFRDQLNQLSGKKELLRQKNYQITFSNEQLEEADSKLAEYKTTRTDLIKNIENVQTNKTALLSKEKTLKKEIEAVHKKQETNKQTLAELTEEINQAAAELEARRSRKQFFEQIITNYEGHSKSTQYVMNRQNQLQGIRGTLADVISVDDSHASLVEIILGDALNYIIVERLADAKKVIQLIKAEQKGRITLIPLDQLSQIKLPERAENGVDYLLNYLKTEDRFTQLIQLLLGDVALATNLDDAVNMARQYPHLRFITPEGETVNFNREIGGGTSAKRGASVIGRKDQLQKYTKLVQESETELERLQAERSLLLAIIDSTEDELAQQQEKLRALQTQLVDLDKQEHQLRYEQTKLSETVKILDDKRIRLLQEIKRISQETQQLEIQVDTEQQDLNELEKETILRTNEYEDKSESIQTLVEEVQKAQLNVSNLKNQLTNRENDIRRTRNGIEELNNNILRREKEIEQIDALVVKIEQQTEDRNKEKIRIWENRDRLDGEKEKLETLFREAKDKIIELEEQTKSYRRRHDSSLETSRTLELKINENRVKAEHIREYILKEYAEDVEIGIPYEDLNEKETEEAIELLRMRIKNLGPVNPLAVAEYDKEKERFDFLTRQRDDLLKAENSLMETIDKINKTARSQFLETFNAIKVNFEKVFKSFFENGEGTISLAENEDPLEADIDIHVRTKGKRLQTLSLLSGGEKTLTAISLLFSIYLVKPSPFCILDEVDAPLDDINIGRFTQALSEFSNNTQFITVTHNKRTMEAASTMYGVTMEEEGVSKLVSVKFS